MLLPLAAVVGAVFEAVGVRVTQLPVSSTRSLDGFWFTQKKPRMRVCDGLTSYKILGELCGG
jgi:hypothetical protein